MNTLPHPCSNNLESTVPTAEQNDQECEDDSLTSAGNAIPLPPRDRSRPLPASKPRHQRKHPLIIPGNATRTLAKLAHNQSEPTYLGLEDEPTTAETAGDSGQSGEEESTMPVPMPRTSQEIITVPDNEDSFEDRIACELDALDEIDEENSNDNTTPPLREHVSCEDLLEFAYDGPNSRRTRGKAQGVDSDEIRTMGKVLGVKVSAETRLAALNATDWDVHRAIKLCRLEQLLPPQHTVDYVAKLCALNETSGDIAKAAQLLLATLEPGEDVTQV